MEVRILGSLRVSDAGAELRLGGPRQQLVQAVLVLHAGTPVPVGGLEGLVAGRPLRERLRVGN